MAEPIEEFAKKYQGTYLRWINPTDKIQHVGYMEFCNPEEQTLHFTCANLGLVMKKYPSCLDELNLESPNTGLFNHNGHALFLFKTPARQWHRGLCASNHEIYNPFRKLFFDGTYHPTFGRAVVESIFSNKFYSDIEEAADLIIQSNIFKSLAITRNLMLSKSPTISLPLIWYKTIPVGFVNSRKFVVEDELYQQEVQDELQRIGRSDWIS